MQKLLEAIDKNQRELANYRPLNQTSVANLKEYLKIGLTYSSNALEGNTLTESETKAVIELGITISGKPLRDHLDALGHARAFEYMWELAKKAVLGEAEIRKLHQICFAPGNGAAAGEYRRVNVLITGSPYNDELPGFELVPGQMRLLCASLLRRNSTQHPVIYAAALHLDFVKIHPFADGNGRVARLLLNHALVASGYPPVVISPYFKHEYINAIHKSYSDADAFSEYIVEQVLQAQRDYRRLLKIDDALK